jgi:hypothetical protein
MATEANDAAAAMIQDAGDAAQDAATDAAEAMTAPAVEAPVAEAPVAEETVTEAPTDGAAIDATVEADGTVTPGAAPEANAPLADLLTPEGFDADAVIERLNESDLSMVQKTTLTAAIKGAQNNPELLTATLTRVREALGL